jgi:hypothetical protein
MQVFYESKISASYLGHPAERFVKQRPTVLDELPLDVIRVFIFPRLDYESRIQLNQCLPPWDRLTKKMSRASIERHDEITVVSEVRSLLFKLEESNTWPRASDWLVKRYKTFIHLFRILQKPRYLNIIFCRGNFRKSVLDKIEEIYDMVPGHDKVDIGIKERLISTLTRLRKKIVAAAPYQPNRMSDDVEPLSFQ